MAFDSARSMKRMLKFLFGLLINVCILFCLVKAFSYSYDFAYQVFATKALNAADTKTVNVQVLPDESVLDVAGSLKKAKVIDNKYAFILKLRIGGYASKIEAGTYQIAPCNTNTEIIDMITGNSTSDSPDDSGSSDGDSKDDN